MFKGFPNTSKSSQFRGFTSLNFQMNRNAYGFSGVYFWLDAAIGLNTQSNGAAISSWYDKVSNVLFSQATAGNQPQFTLSNANFNNLPTVTFQSNARVLVSSLAVGLNNNYTIAFVAKVNTVNTFINTLLGNGVSNSKGSVVMANVQGSSGIGLNSTTLEQAAYDTNAKIVVISATDLVVNGASSISGQNVPPSISFSSLGGVSTSANNYNFLGDIAEILIFNQSLSTADAISLSNKLNTKYAIY